MWLARIEPTNKPDYDQCAVQMDVGLKHDSDGTSQARCIEIELDRSA